MPGNLANLLAQWREADRLVREAERRECDACSSRAVDSPSDALERAIILARRRVDAVECLRRVIAEAAEEARRLGSD